VVFPQKGDTGTSFGEQVRMAKSKCHQEPGPAAFPHGVKRVHFSCKDARQRL
jgi:hypothetical protein